MYNPTELACHECDLMVTIPALCDGQKASCPRCGFVFTRFFKNARSRLFAFSSTALIFLALTFIFPFLIFSAQGSDKTASFYQCLKSLGDETYLGVVLFMVLTTIVIPILFSIGINYVLLSAKLLKPLPLTRKVARFVFYIQAWNMAEIYLLGILVSMIKIASLAHVQFGWSFYAFVLYIASMAITRLYLDKYLVWHWLQHHKSFYDNKNNESQKGTRFIKQTNAQDYSS